MRLFVAINFKDNTMNGLIALRNELRDRSVCGNFSRDKNLHLTLAFIGEVETQKFDKLKAVIDTLAFTPFRIVIDKLGTFSCETLWWAGVRKDKPLMDLQCEIEHKLALCDFEADGCNYHPHVTLGRKVVTDAKPWQIGMFGQTMDKVDLMKSERIDGKLIYTVIHTRQGVGK